MDNRTFKEVLYELFPFACEAGIDAREYWFYTIEEINMTMGGYKKRLATRAALDYKMVDLIAPSVGRVLSKNAKFPKPSEAYPGLIEPERPAQQNWQIAKERLLRFAAAHNAKRRGEE